MSGALALNIALAAILILAVLHGLWWLAAIAAAVLVLYALNNPNRRH